MRSGIGCWKLVLNAGASAGRERRVSEVQGRGATVHLRRVIVSLAALRRWDARGDCSNEYSLPPSSSALGTSARAKLASASEVKSRRLTNLRRDRRGGVLQPWWSVVLGVETPQEGVLAVLETAKRSARRSCSCHARPTHLKRVVQVLEDLHLRLDSISPQIDASKSDADVRVGRTAAED